MGKPMNVKVDKNGRVVGVPFYVDLTLNDFEGHGQQYMKYVDALRDEFLDELETAQPGQPLRTTLPPGSKGDAQYAAAMTAWSVSQGVTQAMQENKPKEEAKPIPRELEALMHGDGKDKARSAELVQWRGMAEDQSRKAAKFFALDGRETRRVLDARQRAGQYQREVENLETKKFTFEERQNANALKWGESELEKFMKAKPEEIEKNRDHVEGLVQGYRDMADTDYSYALDGKQLVKVHHPHIPARELAARLGTTEDRHLLLKLSRHGVERHEEPAPQKKEEEGRKPMNEMTMQDYEKFVQGEEAKAKAKSLTPEIRPGLFGAANG